MTASAGILLALPALVVPLALAGPAAPGSAATVPEACAVAPDIDLTQFNVIIGTNESETLRGTAGPDFICPRLGDDEVFSYRGNDTLDGGS